jgi:hypothetical protein
VLAKAGPCTSKGSGEQSLARRFYPRLEEGWLLIADRSFHNWKDWCLAADSGADLSITTTCDRAQPRRGAEHGLPSPASVTGSAAAAPHLMAQDEDQVEHPYDHERVILSAAGP